MKRIASLLIALTMILSVCAVMSSCDIVNQFIPNADGGSGSGEKETRYTITADEWHFAMTMTNYTLEYSVIERQIIASDDNTENEPVIRSTSTMFNKYTDNAYYTKQHNFIGTLDESTYEGYYVIKDDIRYQITVRKDGTLLPQETSNEFEKNSFGSGLNVKFEDLVYNEESKSYSCSLSVSGTEMKNDFYFENGILVKAAVTHSYEVDTKGTVELKSEMTISDIGTTVINVPEFTVE